jgi:hypothetical protein
MNLQRRLTSGLFLISAFSIACSSKDTEHTHGSPSTNSDGGANAQPVADPWPVLNDAGVNEAEACIYHTDCATQYCLRYSDVPIDPDRQCARAGNIGDMRVTATVRDLSTRDAVADASVAVVGAFAAASNPVAARANPIATLSGDDNGRVDAIAAEVNSTPLGVVALASADGYFLTATGLGAPFSDTTDYAAGNTIHDLWLVSSSVLDDWSGLLAEEAALADALPLGEQGGVIAFVRDVMTGEPLAGAVVRSANDASDASVRYLTEDGSAFTEDQTSEQGIALILNPGIGENFGAYLNDELISTNVAGSAPKVVMVVTFQDAP